MEKHGAGVGTSGTGVGTEGSVTFVVEEDSERDAL